MAEADTTPTVAAPVAPAAPQEAGSTPIAPVAPSAAPPASAAPSPLPSTGLPVDGGPAPGPSSPQEEVPARSATLLERHDAEAKAKEDAAKAAAKPAEPAKVEPPKPTEAAKPAEPVAAPQSVEPAAPAAPAPVAYEYKLPESLKMDDALRTEVHAAFDALRTDPAKGAQALVDLHAKSLDTFAKAYAADALKNQFKVFEETKAGWEKQILGDAEIGGAGHQTAMAAAARVRDVGVSSARPGTPRYEAEMAEFNQFLAATGAGSHPAFVRLLHNLAAYVDEPQSTSLPTNIKPSPSNGRQPGGRFRDVMYDNTRSTAARQNGAG